jgi:tRNA(His) guanylyltransferase
MTEKDSLGDRMKKFEDSYRVSLPPRMPIICRIDGKAFHSYTKAFNKPSDEKIIHAMTLTAGALVSKIQGAKIAYIQSDEISILINNYETINTSAWFDNNLQKIVSVSASIATSTFNSSITHPKGMLANFDSRAFILPKEDVVNYFWWRQVDARRNSISGYAQANFSHKLLQGKSSKQQLEMLKSQGIIWEDLPTHVKQGWCVSRKQKETKPGVIRTEIVSDWNIPKFIDDRNYIEELLLRKD